MARLCHAVKYLFYAVCTMLWQCGTNLHNKKSCERVYIFLINAHTHTLYIVVFTCATVPHCHTPNYLGFVGCFLCHTLTTLCHILLFFSLYERFYNICSSLCNICSLFKSLELSSLGSNITTHSVSIPLILLPRVYLFPLVSINLLSRR